jgi:hypothetical protein
MDVPAVAAVTIGPLLILGVILYTYAQATLDDARDNWVQYRCNPIYMPFAGSIQPEVSTADNFQYCISSMAQQVFKLLLDPIYMLFGVFNRLIGGVGYQFRFFRNFISGIQTFITSFTAETFAKIHDSFGVVMSLMSRIRDIIGRIVGSVGYTTAIAVTAVNLIEALVGYMKTVIIAIVIILFAISILLAFVAPALLGFAIFLGTFVGLSFCFHPDTPIKLKDGSTVLLKQVKVGDYLSSGARVTATMACLAEGVPLYTYGGTIVSGDHLVREDGKWLYVRDSKKKAHYVGPPPQTLICLNTTDHQIPIGSTIFADYEEIEEELDYEPLNPKDTVFTLGGKVPLEKCYPGLHTIDGTIRAVVHLENGKMQVFMGNADGYFYINGGTRKVRDYPDSHDPVVLAKIQDRVLAELNS